ncbi:MAG TPA: MFS transporter [Acidobacteriaceae bacterium]|nr:MFS transporter [Acidobacteriaceae bacterium]
MANSAASGPRFTVLCFGFVLCGMVTVLPGPLLPVMAARWGLRDVQSGAFFAALFLASTVASIFSPRRLRRNLPLGYASMTAGVALLIVAGQVSAGSLGHALALAAFGLVGLGIGLSVTATNLMVGVTVAEPGIRARRISIVNLWWGIGAVVCPWLIARSERAGGVPELLAVLAAGTAGMFVALLPQWRETEPARHGEGRESRASQAGILTFFAAFLFLYVGVETVVGGWITTYAHRFSGMTVERAGLIVSLYWVALLAGRWAGAWALKTVPEQAVQLPALALALAAVAGLVTPHATGIVLVAVAVAGAGFGPVFPVAVSRMLGRVSDHRNTGWVFAVTASGGAVLPWLTGLVSTRTGSLRTGFVVPVAALAAIVLLAAGENRVLGRPGGPAGSGSFSKVPNSEKS